ncbi:hypothetical protein DXA95_12420 [Odoribacter sp. OF09-27XD]|jgi:hypothetical protein|nr:hypothetical protein [Odoribacter sp. OF09-27XD]RHV92603.1 hypothetical protein DXA95_12420 [Odoribacter sp. OF09-27XD]
MIEEKLIEDICDAINTNSDELKDIFSKVKLLGYLSSQELRHLAEMGIPVIGIFTNIMRISANQALFHIKDGKISYSDLCVILGIFGQGIIERRQNKVIDSYIQK